LVSGAVPTVFDLPGHLVNPVQHRKPPAKRNGRELTVPEASKPTTVLSVEHSYAPVLDLSHKRLPQEMQGHYYCFDINICS